MGIEGIDKVKPDDDIAPDAHEPGDDLPDQLDELVSRPEEGHYPDPDNIDVHPDER